MEEREEGRSKSEDEDRQLCSEAEEALLVNLAKAASKTYQRKKPEKLETQTSLGSKSVSDLQTSDTREVGVVRFEVGTAKVRPERGHRFSSELRRQVLEDLQRLPEVEVCKRWQVSRSSTLRWARQAGVQRIHLPRPGHSQQFRDQVLETYREKGLAAACREHGVDKLTVYK